MNDSKIPFVLRNILLLRAKESFWNTRKPTEFVVVWHLQLCVFYNHNTYTFVIICVPISFAISTLGIHAPSIFECPYYGSTMTELGQSIRLWYFETWAFQWYLSQLNIMTGFRDNLMWSSWYIVSMIAYDSTFVCVCHGWMEYIYSDPHIIIRRKNDACMKNGIELMYTL